MDQLPKRPTVSSRGSRVKRRKLSGDANPHTANETATFQGGEDFIAFAASTDEGSSSSPPPEREQDREKRPAKGKSRGHDDEHRRRRGKYSDDDGYANKKQRTDAISRKAPWVEDVDWDSCRNVADMLHQEVQAFIDYILPTPEEDEIRGLIIQLVSRAITRVFPDAVVLPFGSYETKLYLPLGDIDLVIRSEQMLYSDKTAVLQKLASAVRRAGITDRVTVISKARVPIIKFVTTHGRFAVDVSFNQGNGVSSAQMINNYLAELPALRALVMVTKAFLSQRSMNEVYTGGLGSYSIVCLAISFLQMHPKVRRGEMDPSMNLGVLVMEFFELYGCHFNYEEVGISIRDGGTYFNKDHRGWSDPRNPGLLSIEDPYDPSNDVSKSSYGIVRVRQTLAGAYGIMTAAAYQQANTLRSRREGRYIRFDNVERRPPSILTAVMGVTQETINHRRMIKEVYEKKTLHRMVGTAPLAHSNGHSTTSRDTGEQRQPSLLSRISSVRAERDAVDQVYNINDDEGQDRSIEAENVRKRARERSAGSKTRRSDKDDLEETRYNIPSKRSRIDSEDARGSLSIKGARHDYTYTTDEDEEESVDTSVGSPTIEEGEVEDSDGGGNRDNGLKKAAKRRKSERTRDYWLSKGIGEQDGDSS